MCCCVHGKLHPSSRIRSRKQEPLSARGNVCRQARSVEASKRNERTKDACFSELVAITLLLTLALGGLNADLLVVLLERRQVLAGLGELALLHTLTHVPVHEGTLGVHQVKLVVNPAEHLRDGGGIRDHAHPM